jgi:hypothetical protein
MFERLNQIIFIYSIVKIIIKIGKSNTGVMMELNLLNIFHLPDKSLNETVVSKNTN